MPLSKAGSRTLRWAAVEDGATYTVLKNGAPLADTTAHAYTVRAPGANVYRVRATDLAGNVGAPSRAVAVVATPRPGGVPRVVPRWAYALYAYQHHHGTRPKAAPKRPPSWYWRWAAWKALPYRIR